MASTRRVGTKLLIALGPLLLNSCSAEEKAPETPFSLGVAFGASRDEVAYRKGEPSGVTEFVNGKAVAYPIASLPDGRNIASFERWLYHEPAFGQFITVDFTQDHVTGVTCKSGHNSSFGCVYRGLSSGYGGDFLSKSSEDDVRQELGDPDKEEITAGQKVMSYDRLGAYFYLSRGAVDMIQLTGS